MADSLGPKVAPVAESPAEPPADEPKPAERVGLRGHENEPEGVQSDELRPAAPDVPVGTTPTLHSEEYLKPDSTKPASA
jgi:hypothetical protein